MMRWTIIVAVFCVGCATQRKLPPDTVFNTTALRNDSTWFGTARAIRLLPIVSPDSVRQFDIHIATDILFPGREMPDSAFPYTATAAKGTVGKARSFHFITFH